MKKRQFIERKQKIHKKWEKTVSDTCYSVFYDHTYNLSFKKEKVCIHNQTWNFFKKIPNLFTCCLYCLIIKIFQVRDLLKVLCMATWSQLLPSYLNRRNKFLSHREKECNTFSLVIILQHHQIYSNIELVYLSLLMVTT